MSVCNNKQRCNDDKCRCECVELIKKGVCDKGSIWNPSDCEFECNLGKYLDYENCKCRKKLSKKLVEECTATIEKVKLAKITSTDHENKHKYCSVYRVIFSNFYN